MRNRCKTMVQALWFEYFIVALILINAVVIGLETSQELYQQYGDIFVFINYAVLMVFTIEVILKLIACSPNFGQYFKDGWNVFDFSVVVLSYLPATGSLATLARLIRLLRLIRLISVVPELRLIIGTLVRSVPSAANIVLLISLIFYIYGVAGFYLFKDIDPTHWQSLGLSMLTLFRIMTLEDWTDVMYTAMQTMPHAWIYFVSFVVIGTFVVINLFIAVIINNLDEAKMERLESLKSSPSKDELMKQLQDTQKALTDLHQRLQQLPD